ncbi:hypothetical protein BSZ19_04115 [Bradyrhizobium japonicum]|uniref:Uncharacterized protein n=1 Tax=Bradyrhizobium japonicum TaxID=375 RepID=A0A1Y2JWL9_BRAJP|nr:hypothetical protein BSZ19_04115 [Bradyrhizobium japonicum]
MCTSYAIGIGSPQKHLDQPLEFCVGTLSLHAALPCVEIAVASPKSSSRSVGSTCCDARSNAARAWSNVEAEPERCVLGSMPG